MLQYRIHNLGLKNCYYILLPQNDTILEMSIVNWVKQDLAWQFPEAAKIRLTAPLFWG